MTKSQAPHETCGRSFGACWGVKAAVSVATNVAAGATVGVALCLPLYPRPTHRGLGLPPLRAFEPKLRVLLPMDLELRAPSLTCNASQHVHQPNVNPLAVPLIGIVAITPMAPPIAICKQEGLE
eukprot:CAMPEP_0115764714 /NCGR_PEP_ID=MMETSP0272-20121206/102200_1 /TAXON_ID=71861 /ORGANISM="Scrippsiella trochoidea, Strain CCMP3099" /LENGTH=123 /DNA_ID=CAMNT_0003210505 /DNA_START=764 /DNA_END=1137 /DNA_ORIENTATION=+